MRGLAEQPGDLVVTDISLPWFRIRVGRLSADIETTRPQER
jgi:hypothetical protein